MGKQLVIIGWKNVMLDFLVGELGEKLVMDRVSELLKVWKDFSCMDFCRHAKQNAQYTIYIYTTNLLLWPLCSQDDMTQEIVAGPITCCSMLFGIFGGCEQDQRQGSPFKNQQSIGPKVSLSQAMFSQAPHSIVFPREIKIRNFTMIAHDS